MNKQLKDKDTKAVQAYLSKHNIKQCPTRKAHGLQPPKMKARTAASGTSSRHAFPYKGN